MGFLPRMEPGKSVRAPFSPHGGGVNTPEQQVPLDSTVAHAEVCGARGQRMESSVNALLCCASLSLLVKCDLSF